MKEYIDFHNKSLYFQSLIRIIINFSYKLNDNIFCLFWNFILFCINNSVRIKKLNDNSFLVTDSSNEIIIAYKERFEYYMQSINHRYSQLIDEYMLDEINIQMNDIVIDCGANIGEIYNSVMFHRGGDFKFSYYGFEPSKYEFLILDKNTNNLVDRPCALFKENIFKTFYLKGELADSSLIKSKEFNKSTNVECIRLDTFFEEDRTIKLLKLEAEGSELDVLIGSSKILPNINYISADLGFELEDNTENTLIEVNEFLINNGFELINSHKRWVFLYKNTKFRNT